MSDVPECLLVGVLVLNLVVREYYGVTDYNYVISEDCHPPSQIRAVGDSLPDLVLLGYGQQRMAYWIRCPECLEHFSEDPTALKRIERKMERDWEKVYEMERGRDKAASQARLENGTETRPDIKGEGSIVVENAEELGRDERRDVKKDLPLPPWPDVLLVKVNEVMERRGIGMKEIYDEVTERVPKSVAIDRRSWTPRGLRKTLQGGNSNRWIVQNEVIRQVVEHWAGEFKEDGGA